MTKYIESIIDKSEQINNKIPKFGAALNYYPTYIKKHDGEMVFALFTGFELENAIKRGDNNPEDKIPHKSSKGFFSKLFNL